MAQPPGPTALGIDIGGSKTRGVLVDVATLACLADVIVGSANHQSVGPTRARRSLDDLAEALAGHRVSAVFAGAAGADSPAGAQVVRSRLARRFPHALVQVTHDSEILLAAGGLSAGCVLICGTGSVAWGRCDDGRTARSGGWGPLLGDEGSGYVIAADAVRATLAEADRGEPPGPLSQAVLDYAGVGSALALLDRFYGHPERAYWAAMAGVVLSAARDGDAVAVAIRDANLRTLAGHASRVCGRLGITGPILAAGGLVMNDESVAATLRRFLAEAGHPDLRVLDRDPVFGAVDLAVGLLAQRQ